MNYLVNVNSAYVQDDGFAVVVGLSDDESSPSQYVLIQKSKVYDEADKAMGMDRMHIEIGDQSRSRYGGIDQIYFGENSVVINLSTEAEKDLGVIGGVIATFGKEVEMDEVKHALEAMCQEDGVRFSRAE